MSAAALYEGSVRGELRRRLVCKLGRGARSTQKMSGAIFVFNRGGLQARMFFGV
jgi:hypothetical protein